MRRDFGKMRKILLACEASPERWFTIGALEEHLMTGDNELRSDLDESELYQLDLMHEAGLIRKESVVHPGISFPQTAEIMYEITWAGHDYVDAVRDQGVWEKTKSLVVETGGSATLEIVKSLATGFLKKKIEQHTDIKL